MLENISIYCKNTSRFYEVPIGSSLLDIYKIIGEPLNHTVLSAQVNNRTEDLTFCCWQPKDIEFVDYTSPAGMRTYIRSLCHIFSKAVYDVLPDAILRLEHSVSKGYYCFLNVHNRKVNAVEVENIKKRMQEIIDADLLFHRKIVHTADAAEMFRQRGMMDKVRLIETTGMLYTTYYELDGYINYFYGCLTPSTGYIRVFDLMPYSDGVLLRVPQRENPENIAPFVHQEKMLAVYKEHLGLLEALGLDNVGDLNLAIQRGMASEVIMVSEAIQEKQIAHIAEEIAERYKQGTRIVLIAGPSSSGKTTTCKRLEIQLVTNKLRPVGISLDDYFVNREDTPKDADGEYDFESLYAVDIPYFNNDLKRLLAGEEIELPSFDFATTGYQPQTTGCFVVSSEMLSSEDTVRNRPYNDGPACGEVRINGYSHSRNDAMRCSIAPCSMNWRHYVRMSNQYLGKCRNRRQHSWKPIVCSDSCNISPVFPKKNSRRPLCYGNSWEAENLNTD